MLHPAMHQFAVECFATTWSDFAHAMSRQHSAYYLNKTRVYETAIHGWKAQQTIMGLHTDLGNIRQAWQWAVAHTQIDALGRAMSDLATVYELLDRIGEGATLF